MVAQLILDPAQLSEAIRQRETGASYTKIGQAFGVSESCMRRTLERVTDADPAAMGGKEAAFIARLLAAGGMPRAVVVDGRTVWLGADNRPWFDPDRRRAAA